MDEYVSFIDQLERANTFVIASHYNPDGDGIGSCVALGMALERMDKEIVLYNRDPIPVNLRFLPGIDRFVSELPADGQFDMALMVDCAQRKRISDEFAAYQGFRSYSCIDHHLLEDAEADYFLLDSEAASTGEVVFRLMQRAGVKVDADVAQLIYTTLVVDTGFFKYSTTDARVLTLAAELVELGADPWVVAKNIEESFPLERFKLLASSLATLETDLDGRYASMDVTLKMLEETGASVDHSEEFAVYPRSIAGVEVSALFREVEKNLVKVSLRSKDAVDVSALARKMGGGGHTRAAGVRIRGSLKDAKLKILDAVKDALPEEE